MIRVALRGIRAHIVRFALAILAVALGVAFVAGTFSLRSLLAETFDGVVEGAASADVYVRGADDIGGFEGGPGGTVKAPVPASLADEVATVDGVASAHPDFSGTLVLVGADGAAVATAGAPILGLALFPDDPDLEVLRGSMPTNNREIALESAALERSGLDVGDSTKIVIGEDIRDVAVTGELGFEASAGAILVGFDPATAAADFSPDGLVDTISIRADDGVSEVTLRDSLASFLAERPELPGASAAEVVTGDSLRADYRESIDMILGFIQVFLLVFAIVSLFVGGFLITNTFAMSVRERMREFALLRAIGASPGQVFASIVTQALVVGLLGSAVGIAAGVGLAAGLGALLAFAGMELAGSVSLTGQTVVISLLIGTVMSVIAAAIPARRASRTAPVVAMRGEAPSERGLLVRGILGGLLTLAGAAGVLIAALVKTADGDVPDNSGIILGMGAGALMLGALILAPTLARRVVGVLAAPVVAWGKPLGSLARGNVVRNPRRTASTAGALMIGMTLVSAASVVAASATSSIDEAVRTDLKADFLVQGQGPFPEPVITQIEDLDTIRRTDPAFIGFSFASGVDRPLSVLGVPEGFFTDSLDLTVHEGDVSALDRGEALVEKGTAKDAGWSVGDSVALDPTAGPADAMPAEGMAPEAAGADPAGPAPAGSGDDAVGPESTEGSPPLGETTVRIGAIVESTTLRGDVYLNRDVFDEAVPKASSTLAALFVSVADGVNPDTARAEMAKIVEPYYVISIADADDLSDQLAAQINTMLTVIYALLGLAIIIAVLGIVNTLALSIIERTREVALLRAVGLGRLQLATMIAIESVLTALFGTILGVAIGLGIASALPSVLEDQGFGTLVIPWPQLAGMVVLAAFVGLLASLWPAIRASRLPVLEGLAAE